MKRKIIVVDYDPAWDSEFIKEAAHLSEIFGVDSITIHHIGSTSVPGLTAKPIIDIIIEAADISRIDSFDPIMIQNGYIPKGEFGIEGRRFFIRSTETDRTHHVHIFQTGDTKIREHIAFRDYLRSHPATAKEYGDLKKSLAEKYPGDIDGYMDGKDKFIKGVIEKAMETS